MNREEKVHRAIVKREFPEKVHASFVAFVCQPGTAVAIAVILLGVAIFTGSVRATGLAALVLWLGITACYVVWFAVVYFIAYVWTTIIRFFTTLGKAKTY